MLLPGRGRGRGRRLELGLPGSRVQLQPGRGPLMAVGVLAGAHNVRRAMLEMLTADLPPILEAAKVMELEAGGLDAATAALVVAPRTWTRLPDFRALQADQTPAVVVTTPGLMGDPVRRGDGLYDVIWQLRLLVVVRGDTYDRTADLVGFYVACLRLAALRNRIDVDGAQRATWLPGESYHELATDAARTIGAGVVPVAVPVKDAIADIDLTGPVAQATLVTVSAQTEE